MTKTNEREDAPHRTAPCEPALVRKEPKLAPYENLVYNRYMRYENRYHEITEKEGSLEAFGDSYKTYGLHPDPSGAPGAVRYVEYAPSAKRLSLMGDFNDWEPWVYNGVCEGAADPDPETGEGGSSGTGKWTVSIPASAGVRHGSQVRVVMETEDGRVIDRIPSWIQAIAPCSDEGANYHNGIYHDPPPETKHAWLHAKPVTKPKSLRIYEAHVGMSSEEHRYGTYREFADEVLPRVAQLGYNTVQLMAVADHAYYACFGYQVTNFFAVAHRSGSPEDLKYLVDTAHGLGLQVLMDVAGSDRPLHPTCTSRRLKLARHTVSKAPLSHDQCPTDRIHTATCAPQLKASVSSRERINE